MEPRLPTPAPSPEMGNNMRGEVLKRPEQNPAVQEIEPSAEQVPSYELESQAARGAVASTQAATLAQPSASMAQSPAQAASANPLAAKDDDLIEAEWIKRAKQVVEETSADPYLQEMRVSELQSDYLKKRYGMDVKFRQ